LAGVNYIEQQYDANFILMKAWHGRGRRVYRHIMIQVDRPMCKESRVVLRNPENKTCIILAKTGSYFRPKKDYSTLKMLTNKYYQKQK